MSTFNRKRGGIMKKFYIFDEEEDFDNFVQAQHEDDNKLKEMFLKMSHREFQFALTNIGMMLNIVLQYFAFEEQRVKDVQKLAKEKTRNRKVNKMIKELNEKINLRYDFDEKTAIIPSMCLYNNEAYLIINKSLFAELILDKFNAE